MMPKSDYSQSVVRLDEKKYKRYYESLATMKEPDIPKVRLDMRGAIRYAQERGKTVEDLTREEKDRFIHHL